MDWHLDPQVGRRRRCMSPGLPGRMKEVYVLPLAGLVVARAASSHPGLRMLVLPPIAGCQ
jgi:hypothetical protein